MKSLKNMSVEICLVPFIEVDELRMSLNCVIIRRMKFEHDKKPNSYDSTSHFNKPKPDTRLVH